MKNVSLSCYFPQCPYKTEPLKYNYAKEQLNNHCTYLHPKPTSIASEQIFLELIDAKIKEYLSHARLNVNEEEGSHEDAMQNTTKIEIELDPFALQGMST